MKNTKTKPRKKARETEIGGEVLLFGGGAILFYYLFNKKKTNIELPVTAKSSLHVDNSTPVSATSFPLRLGSRGSQVKSLQEALLKLGGNIAKYIVNSGGADGVFGEGTQQALTTAGYAKEISKALLTQIIDRSNHLDKETFQTVNTYLFVDAFFGTSLYKNVSNSGLTYTAEFPIITLPDKTYLGKPTGQVRGSYVEVESVFNKATVKYWVKREDIETFTGNAMDFHSFKSREMKDKTSQQIDTIVSELT